MIRDDVVAIEETSFCEAGTSSQSQVALPTTSDSVVRISESCNDEWSTTSDDEDDDGSKQLAQIRPQSHADNGVKIFNRYSSCRNVSSTVNNTNVYKAGVTVIHNCYCCPASLDFVCKSCVTRRGALFVIIVLLGISLLISLSLRISNSNASKRLSYLEDETFFIAPTTTRKLPISTIFTTPSTTKLSKTVHQATLELNLTANPGWKIISRDEWGAALPNSHGYIGKLILLPPLYVILSETGTNTCVTTEKCMKIVRDIQASSMANFSKPDLVYSFLVGGDGMVYEGRGWDAQAADYDTKLFDRISISVSFIGHFEDVVPTETILRAAKTLLNFGVQIGKLDDNYKLKCPRQLSYMSKNPGDKLYNIIKMWKGWDNRTIEEILLLVEGDESY